MRVLILADELFASRERAMLTRLEVGLADEGVRIIHAIPERSARAQLVTGGQAVFSQAITYSDITMPWADRFRAATLARTLSEMPFEEDEKPVDVIHVFGGGVWGLGQSLAKLTNAGLALEVWRIGLVERAAATRSRSLGKPGNDPLFLAPDHTIERALLSHGPGMTVRAALWGVHTSDHPREILRTDRVPSIMIVGTGRDSAAFHAVISGLAQAVKACGEFLVFMDSRAAHRAKVWPAMERLGLLPRVSLIEELEGRQDLLLHGDVLIHPDAEGDQRSILLEAMGAGMAILAAEDRSVSALIDRQTALLVPDSSAAAWAAAIEATLLDRDRSNALGRSAREYVRANRPASGYVASVLSAYSWLSSNDAIPLRAAP